MKKQCISMNFKIPVNKSSCKSQSIIPSEWNSMCNGTRWWWNCDNNTFRETDTHLN